MMAPAWMGVVQKVPESYGKAQQEDAEQNILGGAEAQHLEEGIDRRP